MGRCFFNKRVVQHINVYLDASLGGLGGVCCDMVYDCPVISNKFAPLIVHLEMYNILIALRLWGGHFKKSFDGH